MNFFLAIVRLLLAAVFAVSGITKIADLPGTRKAVADFGLPQLLARPIGLLLPVVELACAIALIPAGSAWWGAVGVLVLLIVLLAAILVNLARGRTPDCHCFGQLHSEQIGWKTVVRNLVLLITAFFVFEQETKKGGVGLLDALESLSRFELAWFTFAMFAAFQLWFSFHLLKQNGRLLLRVEDLEGEKHGSTAEPPPGLLIHTKAPHFSLNALDGGRVTLAELSDQRESVLLVFIEPGCGACDALLPEIPKWQGEYDDRLSIAIISRGSAKANRAKTVDLNIRNFLVQDDREVAKSYLVKATPSAVLVLQSQIASEVAEGMDAIRALVRRAILPPVVKRGDAVPSLVLADLTGKTVDLGTLRGRQWLLLFWSPSCGFCQKMLSDLKSWESAKRDDSTELLVISSGSFEANRAQGFRSRVLLDPYFGAGLVFGAGGTPAAVVIDENGKVASAVGAGADEVWALAGSGSRGATA